MVKHLKTYCLNLKIREFLEDISKWQNIYIV